MASRVSISNLDINPKILSALQKANLMDVSKILTLSNTDIEHVTKLSKGDVNALKTVTSECVVNSAYPVAALDILKGSSHGKLGVLKLSTGCEQIDQMLRGGILSRGITEIAGVSASGKTQLCLQLCLNVQLPCKFGGLNGGAAYICTEDVFPNKRLSQMIQYFTTKKEKDIGKSINFDDNIFIEHISDLDGLNFCIQKKLPLLLGAHNVKLVIIDSVAAVFRCDYEVREMYQRSKHMCTLGNKLRELSEQHNIPIICVNQVTDSMQKNEQKQIPALGLTWANQIMSRIMLSKTSQSVILPHNTIDGRVIGGIETTVRRLETVFAPHLPKQAIHYVIDQEGIKALT